jgi:diguanylate cyclase (GGDEF)-like protein
VTLRTRLTVTFLAVVIAPVLLGAMFVGGTVTAVNQDRSTLQLDLAAGAVHDAVSSLCQRLQATAVAVALQPPEERAQVAADLVTRGQASAVTLRDAAGGPVLVTAGAPPMPWAECGDPRPAASTRYRAVAARVPLHDPRGAVTGQAWAAERLDEALLARLGAVAGVQVVLLAAGATGPAVELARELPPDQVGRSADGQWVRRLTPAEGQPLPLALVTGGDRPQGLYTLLVVVVAVGGAVAVATAWWLARSTTRPLTELARAADRVTDGDLSARVPVRSDDEAGRLAAAFNRMTQRTQSYVYALTASRDQLRGHLAVLGATLSSTHDLHRILPVILHSAVAATGARAGAVVLLDESGDRLVGHCAEPGRDQGDLPAGPGRPLVVPRAGSLLGAVATTGEPRRGRAGDSELHPDEPGCATYLAAPISAQPADGSGTPSWPVSPSVRGVLAVYDRVGGDDFDDTDLITLRTFAGQAAIAVDNVRTHEEAQRLSLTDPLTGLWNYRHLRDALRREVERANRFRHKLTVLALDLDRFKQVNDVHGHPAGDAVLAEFARRIGSEIREVDQAFRQGGEEFVVLLPETDARGGIIVAERLGAAVRDTPIVIAPRGTGEQLPVAVTVSIGIAVFPDHGLTPSAVLDAADDALYAAKAAGRDTHRMAPDPVAAAELPVPAGARTPDGDLPQAGARGSGPARGGAKPPRQTRGR